MIEAGDGTSEGLMMRDPRAILSRASHERIVPAETMLEAAARSVELARGTS